MAIYEVDPLTDARWREFLQRTESASVFHSPEWLEALHRSYGYQPVVFTTTSPGKELNDGIVFCRVNSWLTGRRLVSLPFSDHCEPLVSSLEHFEEIKEQLSGQVKDGRIRYVELRPVRPLNERVNLPASDSFCFHRLDIKPSSEEIFKKAHKTAIRQMVQRAEREELQYEKGNSEILLRQFYTLFLDTRKRQGLPPTPYYWFRNLTASLGEGAQIRVVKKGEKLVASTFSLKFKKSAIYKYGCSDKNLSNLGGMPVLLWKTILEAKADGLEELDMGRSDLENEGLITFKDRWGTVKSTLTYVRFPQRERKSSPAWASWVAKEVVARVPEVVRIGAGRLLYKHVG